MAVGVDLLKQEGHVGGESAHGLHTLGIELHLAFASSIILSATTAVDAHADGLAANLNNLRLHAVFPERRLDLLQAAERIAIGPRAAIYQ